jgi:hypothetical protein
MTFAHIHHQNATGRHRPGERTRSVIRASLSVLLVSISFASCSVVTRDMFSDRFHRQRYRLTHQELKGLQFYLSGELLAHKETANGAHDSGRGDIILIKPGTPGVLTEVGTNYFRVSFRSGDPGILFMAESTGTAGEIGLYYPATAAPGGGIRQVRDLPDRVVTHQGARYRFLAGWDATLTCERDHLLTLFEKRAIGDGRMK